MTNYELISICKKAYRLRGDVLHQFIFLLESRLDTLLYRSGLVRSIFEARQLINHNNICVNNVVVNKRSYVLNRGDFITILPATLLKLTKMLLSRINKEGLIFNPPVYLEINYKYFMILFLFDVLMTYHHQQVTG